MLLALLAASNLICLAISALSLYFSTRAGSLHELHMQVTSLRSEVSLLDDNIQAKEQRERVRRLRQSKEPASEPAVESTPQRGSPEYKAWLRQRLRGGRG